MTFGQRPPRKRPLIGRERPTLVCSEIDEVEAGLRGSGEGVLCADGAQVRHDGVIAGQHEMIAVVDDLAERRIEVGAATSTGLWRAFVERHTGTFARQRTGGGKPGETRADDMKHAILHPPSPWRSRIIASR